MLICSVLQYKYKAQRCSCNRSQRSCRNPNSWIFWPKGQSLRGLLFFSAYRKTPGGGGLGSVKTGWGNNVRACAHSIPVHFSSPFYSSFRKHGHGAVGNPINSNAFLEPQKYVTRCWWGLIIIIFKPDSSFSVRNLSSLFLNTFNVKSKPYL